MPRIIPHGAEFRRGAERIGNAARRALIIGGEGNADVAIVENRIDNP